MRLPNFLIIGAAKSGTTTLNKYLLRHPQVYMSSIKEPQFFAVDEIYAKGLDWYSSLFNEAKPDQVCGEASTDYTKFPLYPETASRIAKTLPDIKMIYIMRNPVDRAYAYYMHRGRKLGYKETFEERINETGIYINPSYYMMQIEQYLQFFPKESFLFLLMDDFLKEPAKVLRQICHFIGVNDDIDLTQEGSIVANSGKQNLEFRKRKKITAPLRQVPILSNVADVVPQTTKDSVYNLLQQFSYGKEIQQLYTPQPMLPETRQMLLEKFKEPNQKLAEFLNRDLSCWDK
ncbi:sulfotransferase [Gloeothece citriformis PCC 7424]|uniref:Sulfotransferase n=1 Tax=Gloeothece citriformis (strain PCC 7424) TaxID=65393 RepID=B7KDT1_GLOC7|nr:sulfotransferase [Gloeothece citriformis]ACK70383.1 sulfotransferase [Gloeothece citriformis PCC 7424]